MKRLILIRIFSLTLGGLVFLAGCKEKPQAQEKAPATTQTTTNTPESFEVPVVDKPIADTAQTAAKAPETKQGQKFGYINSADLIQLMPETKKAEASLNAYVKTLENQFGSLQKDYQKQITDYQSQEKTMVDAVKQSKIQAITQLEQQMQQAQMTSQQQIAAKREALFKPILDKAEKAVKAVGKENNYDYIFDGNTGSFVYANESHNVLPLVKAKLGLK